RRAREETPRSRECTRNYVSENVDDGQGGRGTCSRTEGGSPAAGREVDSRGGASNAPVGLNAQAPKGESAVAAPQQPPSIFVVGDTNQCIYAFRG
ncbi:unnamed protein product, partial [Pylaiella littoralis]